MNEAVCDASAALAIVFDEPGAAVVVRLIGRAAMSAVGICEVVSRLAERGMTSDRIRGVLDGLQFEVIPFDLATAVAAGELRPRTMRLGLSRGDRATIALAIHLGLPAVTADRIWAEADLPGLDVILIR